MVSSYRIVADDCIRWLGRQRNLNLVFGSPPYEDRRSYGGIPSRVGQDWVDWMVEVTRAAVRACSGLVAWVVAGKTSKFRWSGTPALLMADLLRAGFNLRCPPIFGRLSSPGAGHDFLRNDYEHIVCVTPPGRLPWSDPTACGHAPENRSGRHTKRLPNGKMARQIYRPPGRVNPGNIIHCGVLGGNMMGHPAAHKNEASFPLRLAEVMVQSFCPPGGRVGDPFTGSGTTGHAALLHGRRFRGCDLRPSQVALALERLREVRHGTVERAAAERRKRGHQIHQTAGTGLS